MRRSSSSSHRSQVRSSKCRLEKQVWQAHQLSQLAHVLELLPIEAQALRRLKLVPKIDLSCEHPSQTLGWLSAAHPILVSLPFNGGCHVINLEHSCTSHRRGDNRAQRREKRGSSRRRVLQESGLPPASIWKRTTTCSSSNSRWADTCIPSDDGSLALPLRWPTRLYPTCKRRVTSSVD